MSEYFKDWLDHKNYEGIGFTPKEWAWEFLRRSSSYQQDYKKYNSYPFTSDLDKNNEMTLEHFTMNPPSEAGENFGQYMERIKVLGSAIWSAVREDMLEPYGINEWVSPHSDRPPEFEANYGYPYLWSNLNFISRKPYKDEIHFTINVTLDVESQLREVKNGVLEKRKELGIPLPKLHLRELPGYLRILDAKAKGATNNQIAKILFPEDTDHSRLGRLDKANHRANALCEGEYIELIKSRILSDD